MTSNTASQAGMTAIAHEKLYKMKAEDPTANLDILWKTSILFRFSRPSWSGMTQFLQKGKHPGMSSIRFLPMIDMNPSDATCVSILHSSSYLSMPGVSMPHLLLFLTNHFGGKSS